MYYIAECSITSGETNERLTVGFGRDTEARHWNAYDQAMRLAREHTREKGITYAMISVDSLNLRPGVTERAKDAQD